jgi:tetratricopeptide (TPR) repeat protein
MTIQKAELDALLGQARAWLNTFSEFRIHPQIQSLLRELEDALQTEDYISAWRFVRRLRDLTDNIPDGTFVEVPERSFARIECGLAAYRMGNFEEAITLFETAIQLYGPKYARHYEATAKWMLGCVQWQTPNQEDNALVSWTQSIDTYERLVIQSQERLSRNRSAWYADRVNEMRQALEVALQPPSSRPAPSSSRAAPDSSPTPVEPRATEPPPAAREDVLRFLFLGDEIVAGKPRLSDKDSDLLEYLELDRFLIDGLPHRMISLRGNTRMVTLAQLKNYAIVKVIGESMNATGIDDGDYVLLRFQQSPEDNDIVAAKIVGLDTEATLKRFRKRGKEIMLQFRSNNPKYKEPDGRDKELTFDMSDESLQIVGIAVAVFKRV